MPLMTPQKRPNHRTPASPANQQEPSVCTVCQLLLRLGREPDHQASGKMFLICTWHGKGTVLFFIKRPGRYASRKKTGVGLVVARTRLQKGTDGETRKWAFCICVRAVLMASYQDEPSFKKFDFPHHKKTKMEWWGVYYNGPAKKDYWTLLKNAKIKRKEKKRSHLILLPTERSSQKIK